MVDIIELYPGSPILSSGLNYNFSGLNYAIMNAGGGVQTYTIAASGALLYSKADFKCDSIEDDVQINAAIGSLSSVGGALRFTEGTFYITQPILINKPGILIEGVSPANMNVKTTTFTCSGLNGSTYCLTTNGATIDAITIRNLYINQLATGSAVFGAFNSDGFILENCNITSSGLPILGTAARGLTFDDDTVIRNNTFTTRYISGLNKHYGYFNNCYETTISDNTFAVSIPGSLLMPSGIMFAEGDNIRIQNNKLFVGYSPPYNVLDLTDANNSHFWVNNNHIYAAPGYRADTVATKAIEWGGRRAFFSDNIVMSESSGTSIWLNADSDDTIVSTNISALFKRAVPICNSGTGNLVVDNLIDP